VMADNRTSVALSAPPHGGSLEGRAPGPSKLQEGCKGSSTPGVSHGNEPLQAKVPQREPS